MVTTSKENLSNPGTDIIKILIVDDDAAVCRLIQRYLQDDGYVTVTANSGKEALEIIKKDNELDLVVLDLMMPHLSGFDVTRILREKFSLFELPVLILTAKNNVEDIVHAFNEGANDYLVKPFDQRELKARVNTLIKLKKLTRANNILQQAVEVKNQFINMTIHDLKNPISVVVGFTQLMQQEISQDSEMQEYLNLILESSELMMNLINELLDQAKMESGMMKLSKSEINLYDEARAVINNNRKNAERKRQEIDLINETNGTLPIVFADQMRIREVLDNLISNAVKYSPYDKKIEVKVAHYENENKGRFIRVIVKDYGPGLTDEDKQKIFGQFQRLSARPTGGESSSGLGLSICKQLIELHNGFIGVESEVGNGSAFYIDLPEKLHTGDNPEEKSPAESENTSN